MREPHAGFADRLAAFVRRVRLHAVTCAVLAGAVVSGGATVVAAAAGLAPSGVRTASALAGLVAAAATAIRGWRRISPMEVAAAIERRAGDGDNLVVTAAERLDHQRRPLHPAVHDALFDRAALILSAHSPRALMPLTHLTAVTVAALVAAVALAAAFPRPRPAGTRAAGVASNPVNATEAVSLGDLRVTLRPPDYAGGQAVSRVNPQAVSVLEGTMVRMELEGTKGPVRVSGLADAPVPFTREGGMWAHEFVGIESRVLVIERAGASTDRPADHLLHVQVEPDRRPAVRIRTPAKDLLFAAAAGEVPVTIEATDDVRLGTLALRYTKVAGSGETFAFQEGELPVRIEVAGDTAWTGHATIGLGALGLQDGDTLVYRAVARDARPGGDPGASESYLIEIGRAAGLASTGFALPDDRDRQALSQQMLIIKTEQLDQTRSTLAPDVLQERAQMLAIEQRMVKAEFVFMTGGEVQDEVEEAEHSHDLAEGRLENAAQVELLTAIREMSRAEARLNDADTAGALVFERAALTALQRAFDRRRYLLRALPERARIDTARRLTGERDEARPARRATPVPPPEPRVARARQAMRALAEAVAGSRPWGAALAAEVLAIDPAAARLQQAAAALVTARAPGEKESAARDAQAALADVARAQLAPAVEDRVEPEPLAGRLADAVARQKGSR